MKPETTMTDNAVKKDIQKLQRAIVDGLEDVKAQDIQVFNTEHLSPLFERVVVASGTSNRQTKALAVSVRDAVREAGFPKPRTEGEDNGEWIIVDCGQAVVHVMQPAIRQYYHLEDLWGDKPVRLKHGAEKPMAQAAPKKTEETRASAKPASLKRSSAAKKGAADAFPSKAQLQKAAAKSAGKKPAPAKTAAGKTPARKAAKPAAPKVVKVNATKPAGKSTGVKSAPAKKASTAKPAAQRSQASKSPTPKAPAKKVVAKKAPARKVPAKKATASKSAARRG
ncbi:ribosome silencing factor [Hylemonella gracilis]|uniref:Ribosomal silencing factor RsfS n=1 Tax=Hylemonella gracilis ATCC 19624 TaxID=887062 RepID=F3KNU5_9BURK|nr:ribosome silencing factor [Hylemonella gracilis]EGI78522.1 Iojap-like protein [Hylemonella gracilis ATCC 19624]